MNLDKERKENIFSQILKSTKSIQNQIELIQESKDIFTNDKELIIFSYLLGYLSYNNFNLDNKEKLLNIILEFSSRNRTKEKEFSDTIENISLIISKNLEEDKKILNNNSLFSLNLIKDKSDFLENGQNDIKQTKPYLKNKTNIFNNTSLIKENKSKNTIELDEDKEDQIKEKNEINNNSINKDLIIDNKNIILNENKINNNNYFNIKINSENNFFSNVIKNKTESDLIGKKTLIFENIKKCKICLDDFDENDILNYELECGCIIHYKCFDEYIKNSVENNNIPILCPYCRIEIHPNLIYDSLNTNHYQDLIQKFEKYSMDNYLLNHTDNYSCCPTAGCEYIFFFLEGENRFLCPICQKEYCLFCKEIWHKEMTCQEYQDSKDTKKCDEKFLKFVQGARYKICPKCGVWVEKTQGCNNMKCRCGNHFCYKCGKPIPKKEHDCRCWFKNH